MEEEATLVLYLVEVSTVVDLMTLITQVEEEDVAVVVVEGVAVGEVAVDLVSLGIVLQAILCA